MLYLGNLDIINQRVFVDDLLRRPIVTPNSYRLVMHVVLVLTLQDEL